MRSELPAEWSERRLADCGVWLSGGTPTKSVAEYWGGEIPWVGPKDLHVRYVHDAEERLTDVGLANGTRLAPEDSILIVVRSMALANGLQIGLARRPVAFNQDIKAILPGDGIRSRFLHFALWGCHDALHALVDEASHGTKRLRTEVLGDYRIPLPPLLEQDQIARVLGALDDKIDSNRRLATLLEQTAAELFRARFVDFVGVEEFEDSEIGHIPSGWLAGSLSDLGRFVNGKAFTKEANGRGRPILRIKELNGGVRDDTSRTDIDTTDDHLARHRDILFAWSGSLDVHRWSGPESLINQHIFKVVPKGYPAWFVYQWIQQHMREFQAIARDKATTMGHIQRRHLAEATVPLPTTEVIERVSAVIDPLDEQQSVLAAEVGTLTELRDALLPKLVSGEIRVPDTADPNEVTGQVSEQLAATTR